MLRLHLQKLSLLFPLLPSVPSDAFAAASSSAQVCLHTLDAPPCSVGTDRGGGTGGGGGVIFLLRPHLLLRTSRERGRPTMIMMRGGMLSLSISLPPPLLLSHPSLSPTLPDRSFYLLLLFSVAAFSFFFAPLPPISCAMGREGREREKEGGHYHSIRPSTLLHTVWEGVGFENEVGRRRRGGKIASLRLLLLFAPSTPFFVLSLLQ